MKDADVIVVGAGITGLRVALEVATAGLSVIVLERSSSVGGRMRTTTVNGYRLDHGFQVVLAAYPELRRISGLDPKKWRSFSAGARIRTSGRFFDFMDPRRHPDSILAMIRSPICSKLDLLRLLSLLATTKRGEPRAEGIPISQKLRDCGFSEHFLKAFLRPFLRGVLLDESLSADAGTARFYLRTFGAGDAVLPPTGIQGLPDYIASLLGSSHIRLGVAVKEVSAKRVVLESGETLTCEQTVCATDGLNAAALGSPEQTMPHTGCTTLYFGARTPPFSEPILVLNGDDGPIAHLVVLSNIEPKYAPAGAALISVTVLGAAAHIPEQALLDGVRAQLRDWYGSQVDTWQYLQRFDLPHALPTRPRLGPGWIEKDGVLYAGDYLSYPSQNGALCAGRQAGEAIVNTILAQAATA
jgi:phytoene dehydrogenase-like protein